MPDKITQADFERMLADLDVPDAEIARYLRVEESASRPFSPAVMADLSRVEVSELEGAVALAIFNGISRRRRQRRYRRRIDGGWPGRRAVSEGDSWFQYPFLLEDVIDQLWDDYAILSFGAAGDVLRNVVEQDEVSDAIEAENADLFLISGGGNDVVGDGALRSYLNPFEPGREPEDYLSERFDAIVEDLIGVYRGFLGGLLGRFPDLAIVCHGYDYTVPEGGRWLGRPMESPGLGITDRDLQRRILRVVIDRYNDALDALARELGPRVRHVDCRGVVGDDRWKDELHPTNAGFEDVAELFRKAAG